MAMRLKVILAEAGLTSYMDSPTNQQFVVMPNAMAERLKPLVDFTLWGPLDDSHMLCRFVTSWATTDADLAYLRDVLTGCGVTK